MRTLFVFLAFLSLSFVRHPIHISRTEIHYQPQRQSLEIAIKIFADDLQAALSALHKENIEIGTDREHPQATLILQNYLKERFYIQVNGQFKEWEYVGRETDSEDFFSVWVYLKVPKVTDVSSVGIQNSILHEYLDNQDNVVIFNANGKSQRASLRKYENAALFSL